MQPTTIVPPCIPVVSSRQYCISGRDRAGTEHLDRKPGRRRVVGRDYRNMRQSRRETAGAAIDRAQTRSYTRRSEPVAQPVEHLTFNQGVVGSSPTGLAK